ncbi:MAG: PDZ domain-containing protein [candidate division WOR-3 bacterium]|nr:PDZ domain-containing protein [candidate division WOR-3 bacterium]
MAAGAAKLQHVQEEMNSGECARVLTTDLACQYILDADIKMEELGSKLPSVFDSLPAVLVVGVERAVSEPQHAAASAASLTAARKSSFGFMFYWDEPGIVVDSVCEGKQAHKAGLCRGDVIAGANDTLRFGNMWDFDTFKATQPVNVPFTLNVLRDGRPLKLKASFASQ